MMLQQTTIEAKTEEELNKLFAEVLYSAPIENLVSIERDGNTCKIMYRIDTSTMA